MTDTEPPDKSPEQLRAELGEIRAELGDTVEELAHRVDVPAQVRAKTSLSSSIAMSQRTPSQRRATDFNSSTMAARVAGFR